MAVSVREREIERLVRFYRQSIRQLADDFVGAADFEKPRVFAQLQQSFGILDNLDEKTARWADRNIKGLYKAAQKEAEKEIAALGISIKDLRRANAFSVVNQQAIEALLVNPEVGLVSNLREATDQIRNRMKSIQEQAKMLSKQQKLFDATIARVGFLEGRSINEIRDRLVEEMVSFKSNADLLFTAKAAKLPPGQIIRDVADLPFVKIPDARFAQGYRRLRVDKYAEMLARTKTGQASNLARRNKALEHGIELVQISKNKPLEDDACALYIGKVFALTPSAKEEYGVPLVSELPNGGAPFHPNCTHQELQFVIEFESDKERALAFVPPPAWSLNRPWSEVQKEFRRRGGIGSIGQFNEQMKRAVDTGGRQRRGYGDAEQGPPPEPPPDEPSGPGPFPKGPAKPPVPVPDVSIVEGDLFTGLLPQLADVATGMDLAQSFEGLASETVQKALLKRARSMVDKSAKDIEGLSSGARERLVGTVPPRLVTAATKSAQEALIRKKVSAAAREAMDKHALDTLANNLTTETDEFSAELMKVGKKAARQSIPGDLHLSSEELDAILEESLASTHNASLTSARALEGSITTFFQDFSDEWQVAGFEFATGLIRTASEENLAQWKALTGKHMTEVAKKIAAKTFDDPRIAESISIGVSDDAEFVVKAAFDEFVDQFKEFIALAKKYRADVLTVTQDLTGDVAQKVIHDLYAIGTKESNYALAEQFIKKRITSRMQDVASTVPGFEELPTFMQKQAVAEIADSNLIASESKKLIDSVREFVEEQQDKVTKLLGQSATNKAEAAADGVFKTFQFDQADLKLFESTTYVHAFNEASSTLSALEQFGINKAVSFDMAETIAKEVTAKKVKDLEAFIAKAKKIAGKVAEEIAAEAAAVPPAPALKFTKAGKLVKKSAQEVADKFALDFMDDLAAQQLESHYYHFPFYRFEKETIAALRSHLESILPGSEASFLNIEKFIKSAKIRTNLNKVKDAYFQIRNSIGDDSLAKGEALSKLREILGRSAPKVVKVKEAPAVIEPFVSKVEHKAAIKVLEADFPAAEEVQGLRVVKKLGGSTGAELVEDSSGRRFVKKLGTTADQIREEFRAEQIYRSLGVPVPESKLYETASGPIKLSQFKDGKELGSLSASEQKKIFEKLKEDFGIDAVLSNWDVAGLSLDNVLVDAQGTAWRIDVGGSLRFRATGKLKNAGWNENPTELWSLLDAKVNAQSAKVFAGLTHQQRLDALERVVSKKAEILSLIDDANLREVMTKRLDEVEDMVISARNMAADGFGVEGFVEGVNKASVEMLERGLRGQLPKTLKRGRSHAYVVDDNGKDFDSIRGQKGVVAWVKDYMEEKGGDYWFIQEWFDAQGGSSWSTPSKAGKWLIATERSGVDPTHSSIYWGTTSHSKEASAKHFKEGFEKWVNKYATLNNLTPEQAEEKFRKTFRMWSAFQQQRLRLVDITRNDKARKVLRVYRTEAAHVLRSNNVARNSLNADMSVTGRGLADSTSLYQAPHVGGNIVTTQDIPHHRIWGTWWDNIAERSAFMNEDENEILAMLSGIRFDVR